MRISCATSFDERFDPQNVLDPTDMKTFWITTGLYPQELMIHLEQPQSINDVKFQSTGGKLNYPIQSIDFVNHVFVIVILS